jgi:fructose-1,6-bisphosphatase II
LDGVKYYSQGARTSSLVVRGLSGTVRQISSIHRWDKLRKISSIKY